MARGMSARFTGLCALAGVIALAGAAGAQTGGQPIIGARPAAMGESFVAVADDGSAAYWNPAGLTSLRNHELHSMSADLFGTGLNSNYLGYAQPVSDRYAAGILWHRIGFSDEELTFGQNLFVLSSAYELTDDLAFGINFKWNSLDSELEGLANPPGFSSTGSGAGFDVGLLWQAQPGVRLGLMAQDIGDAEIEYENGVSRTVYPMNLRLGTAYRVSRELLLSGTLDQAVHLGGEYRLHPAFALRGGLQRDMGDAAGLGLTFGAGARYKFTQVDYAYADSPGLGGTHRFSLSIAFNLSASVIKIHDPELSPVFPALQNRYSHDPVGTVKLTNTSREPVSASVSLFIPEAMASATEVSDVILAPGADTIDLFALFKSDLGLWTRNRMVPAEIQVSYLDGSRTRSTKKQGRVTIYKRNAIRWEEIGVAAAFVTADDEAVAAFTSGVLRPHEAEVKRSGRSSRTLMRATLLFDALSAYGVRYLADPNTPYEQIAGKDFVVDSIKYPAETLASRTGDCDDCTALYCSLLENAGISTALIDAPGHILMAFDTGVAADEAQKLGLPAGYYLERDDRLWVPVEVTLLGQSFNRAWTTAVQECLGLERDGKLLIATTRSAWKMYAPSAPQFDVSVTAPPTEEVLSLFETDWLSLNTVRKTFFEDAYISQLARKPADHGLRASFVYNLLQIADYERALSQLDVMEEHGASMKEVENNRAVVNIMQGDLASAESRLQQVLAKEPEDRSVRRNLEIVRARMGQTAVALGTTGAASKGERGDAVDVRLEDLQWVAGTDRTE